MCSRCMPLRLLFGTKEEEIPLSRGGWPSPGHRGSQLPGSLLPSWTRAFAFAASRPSGAARGAAAVLQGCGQQGVKDEGHCAPSSPPACRALKDRSYWAPSQWAPGLRGLWTGGATSRDTELPMARLGAPSAH